MKGRKRGYASGPVGHCKSDVLIHYSEELSDDHFGENPEK